MKTLAAVIALSLSLVQATVSQAAILPFPTVTSATVYARYNGENVTTSGSDVTTWYNLHPSSFQATLNASAHTAYSGSITPGLPNLMSSPSEINGLPYLRFTRTSDSVGDALRTGTLTVLDESPSTDAFTIFHVGRFNSATGTDPEWYDGVDSTHRKALLVASSGSPVNRPTLFTTATGFGTASTPVGGDFHIWTTVFNSSLSEIWLDGALMTGSLSAGTQSAWAGFSIGGRHTDSPAGQAYFINADFAELVAVRGTLSSEEFNLIGSYLEFKYGLDTAFPDVDFSAPVPEPSSLLLVVLSLTCLATSRAGRRRRA